MYANDAREEREDDVTLLDCLIKAEAPIILADDMRIIVESCNRETKNAKDDIQGLPMT